jgi:hypothetical protein
MARVAGFNVNTEVKEAYAHYQGVDVSGVTDDDVRRYAMSAVETLVQAYRRSQREAATPIDQAAALS